MSKHFRAAMPFIAAAIAAAALGGCASSGALSSASSSAFVDPAKFSAYDCKQLDAARKPAIDKVSELQGLMAKAEQGAGGALVSGLAYQTEYLSARDNLRLLEEERLRNRCLDEVVPPAAAKTRRKR